MTILIKKATLNEDIYWDIVPSFKKNKDEKNIISIARALHEEGSGQIRSSFDLYIESVSNWIQIFVRELTDWKFTTTDGIESFRYLGQLNLSFEGLIKLIEYQKNRIGSKKKLIEIDLMALSNSIWNTGLFFRSKTNEFNRGGGLSDFLEHIKKSEIANSEELVNYLPELAIHVNQRGKKIEELVIFLDSILLVADTVNKINGISISTPGRTRANPYLQNALIADLMSSIYMSLLLILNSIDDEELIKAEDTILDKINRIIDFSNNSLSFQIPILERITDFLADRRILDRVKSLVRLCILTWRSLNLESLSNSLSIKNIHFNAVISNEETSSKSSKSASELLKLDNIYGVMANLVVALSEKKSYEMQSHFFYASYNLINGNRFGQILKDEMFIILFLKYLVFNNEMSDFSLEVDHLCTSGNLDRIMSSTPDSKKEALVVRLLNLAQLVDVKEQAPKLLNAMERNIHELKNVELKEQLLLSIKANKIISHIAVTKYSTPAEYLAKWEGSKGSYIYAEILYSLIGNNLIDENVVSDAMNVLNRNFNDFSFNHFYLLAISMTEKMSSIEPYLSNGDREILIEYLDKSFVAWEEQSSAALNITCLRQLRKLNPEEDEKYLKGLTIWIDNEVHIHDSKLKYFLENRKYFDVFRFFYKILRNFGLKADLNAGALETKTAQLRNNSNQEIQTWINNGAVIPEPLVKVNGSVVVSSNFLFLGNLLFESSAFNDETLNVHRPSLQP